MAWCYFSCLCVYRIEVNRRGCYLASEEVGSSLTASRNCHHAARSRPFLQVQAPKYNIQYNSVVTVNIFGVRYPTETCKSVSFSVIMCYVFTAMSSFSSS